jgi:hypothetical protein
MPHCSNISAWEVVSSKTALKVNGLGCPKLLSIYKIQILSLMLHIFQQLYILLQNITLWKYNKNNEILETDVDKLEKKGFQL